MKNEEEELKEIEEIIHVSPREDKGTAKIFFDGKQYSVRIPKRFVEALKIKPKEDYLEFTLIVPMEPDEHPKLEIRLVQSREAKKETSV